jgi:hypothetical protein
LAASGGNLLDRFLSLGSSAVVSACSGILSALLLVLTAGAEVLVVKLELTSRAQCDVAVGGNASILHSDLGQRSTFWSTVKAKHP